MANERIITILIQAVVVVSYIAATLPYVPFLFSMLFLSILLVESFFTDIETVSMFAVVHIACVVICVIVAVIMLMFHVVLFVIATLLFLVQKVATILIIF